MRVLVTGGRTFQDRDWLWAGLDLLHSMSPITEIIEGGAPGADVRAQEWSFSRLGKNSTHVEADWDKHGRSAGILRNIEMADMRPDIVLATPGGRGTAHMVATAQQKGLKVVMLERMPVKRGPVAEAPPPVIIDAA